MVEAALGTTAVLQVGFKNRFAPLVQRLRAWVRDGRLGSPLAVRIGAFDERYDPTDGVHTARIQGFLEHGPPVVHEGAHSADLLLWLLGPVARVQATALRSRPEFPSPNLHAALLEHADGSRARLEVGWWFPQLWPGEVQLYGPAGSAALSRPDGRLTFGDGRSREVGRGRRGLADRVLPRPARRVRDGDRRRHRAPARARRRAGPPWR